MPLALASCAQPKAPPQPASLPAPPPPPPPAPAARPILRTTWSFHAGQDACTALARSGPASLSIAIHPEGPIRLTLSLPRDPPEQFFVRFNGPAGRWQIDAGYKTHHTASFALPRTDLSLGRILTLLSGGLLTLEPPGDTLPILSLPESGNAGAQWFACAMHSVNGT